MPEGVAPGAEAPSVLLVRVAPANDSGRRLTRVDLLALAPPDGWHPIDPSRIGPPPRPERTVLHRVASRILRRLGRDDIPNLFLLLLRTPRLVVPWTAYASRLMPYGRLPALDRERMILRIAWSSRCRYEWLQHLEIGLSLGLTPADVRDAVTPADALASLADRRLATLLSACDELHRDRRLTDETYRALEGIVSEPLLIEVLMLVAHYEGLAAVLNSVGVEPEAEVLRKIARAAG
ncbi:MAG: carboxymuconolactone decarboxylase family protein [Myxococcota bacterium]